MVRLLVWATIGKNINSRRGVPAHLGLSQGLPFRPISAEGVGGRQEPLMIARVFDALGVRALQTCQKARGRDGPDDGREPRAPFLDRPIIPDACDR
jgi:hypothetical protein